MSTLFRESLLHTNFVPTLKKIAMKFSIIPNITRFYLVRNLL